MVTIPRTEAGQAVDQAIRIGRTPEHQVVLLDILGGDVLVRLDPCMSPVE